jgi:D-sedoheptulose 7-phosphate isomerase
MSSRPGGTGDEPALRGVQRHLTDSAATTRLTAETCAAQIVRAAEVLVGCFERGGKVLLCGNGGSAADAQHMAAEFMSVLDRDTPRRALAAVALTTDTSFLTASANDFGFEGVFARQVEGLGRPGDVLIAISTSGSSLNVVLASVRARELGMQTIALTGAAGGKLADVADVLVAVPSRDVQHIQEAHLALGHALCLLTERRLFGPGTKS